MRTDIHNYGYQELIALQASGQEIPLSLLARAKRVEDEAQEQTALQAQIAADLKTAKQEQQAALQAKLDKFLPELEDKQLILDRLHINELEAQRHAREALQNLNRAHDKRLRAYGAIARLVRDEFGETTKDNDGNPLPGQTGRDNVGRPMIEGVPVDRPYLPYPWSENTFQFPEFR